MIPKIIKEKISHVELAVIMKENFGEMVKVVVDVKKGICAIGGEFHAEGKKLLMQKEGSKAENLWGVRLYPWENPAKRLDYTSQINPRPQEEKYGAIIEDERVRRAVKDVVNKLLLDDSERLD